MHLISPDLLKQQNAETSSAIIDLLATDADFQKLAKYEGELTITRDREDDEKLAKGIEFAKSKGVIDPHYEPEPYQSIDVLGKTPEQVADTIWHTAIQSNDTSNHDGKVIVLVGLSGTGKGTTVTMLRARLQADGYNVVTWSNGNIFRSVTLLTVTWCEQNGVTDVADALTKENLASFMTMLSFGKHPDTGLYDTHIVGLGLDLWVSKVQNTDLKSPKVSKNIPTVAEATQVRIRVNVEVWTVVLKIVLITSCCVHEY